MVARSPSKAALDGSRLTMNEGIATASTKHVHVPEESLVTTGTQLLRGWTALTGWPSGVNTNPSAWKPAPRSLKPRLMVASTLMPFHCPGTRPEIWNQVVDHGAPHL